MVKNQGQNPGRPPGPQSGSDFTLVGSCPQSLAWFVDTPAGWCVENPDGKSDEKMDEMDGWGVPVGTPHFWKPPNVWWFLGESQILSGCRMYDLWENHKYALIGILLAQSQPVITF